MHAGKPVSCSRLGCVCQQYLLCTCSLPFIFTVGFYLGFPLLPQFLFWTLHVLPALIITFQILQTLLTKCLILLHYLLIPSLPGPGLKTVLVLHLTNIYKKPLCLVQSNVLRILLSSLPSDSKLSDEQPCPQARQLLSCFPHMLA